MLLACNLYGIGILPRSHSAKIPIIYLYLILKSEVKIVLGVVIANVLDHLSYTLLLVTLEWYQTVFYVLTDEVTECAAEILMPWIREE